MSQKLNGERPENKNTMTTIEHDPRNETHPIGNKNNTRKDTMIERTSNEPSIGSAILALTNQNPPTKNEERRNATNDAREQAIATVPTTTEFFPRERVTKL